MAFIIHGSMQFLPGLFFPPDMTPDFDRAVTVVLDELKNLTALLPGLALYAEKPAPETSGPFMTAALQGKTGTV